MADTTHSIAGGLLLFSRSLLTSLSRTFHDQAALAAIRVELDLPPLEPGQDNNAANAKFVEIDSSLSALEARPAQDLTFDESVGELLVGGKKFAELVELMLPGKDAADPRTYADIAYALATIYASEWLLRRKHPKAFAIVRCLMFGYERWDEYTRFDPFKIFDRLNSTATTPPVTTRPGFGASEYAAGLVVPTVLIASSVFLAQLSSAERINEMGLRRGARYLAGKMRFKLGWDPSPNTAATVQEVQSLLTHAFTLELGGAVKKVDSQDAEELSLLITALALTAEDGGPGFLFQIGGTAGLKMELQTQAGGAIKEEFECNLVGPGGAQFLWNTGTGDFKFLEAVDPDPVFEVSLGIRGTEAVPAARLGKPNRSRFDVGGLKGGLSLGKQGFLAYVEFKNCEIVVDLGEVLPGTAGKVFRDAGAGLIGGRVDGKLKIGPKTPLSFEGEAGLKVRLASNGVNAGKLRFDYLDLEFGIGTGGALKLSLMAAVHFKLAMFGATVDRTGLAISWNNAGGRLSEKFEFLPPKGIGLSMHTPVFDAGGYLYLDPDKGEYAGSFEASVLGGRGLSVQVVVILATKVPDDAAPYTLFVAGFVRVPGGLEIFLGFRIFGLGLLLGLHHSFDRAALESALSSGAMDDVMFPRDVAADAPRIINSLRKIFPVKKHAFTIGVMIEVGWGSNSLTSLRLGLILPFDNVIGGDQKASLDCVVLLGRIGVVVFEGVKLRIELIADLVGEIRWAPDLSITATGQLRNSRIGLIGVDGTFAARVIKGSDPNFVASAGGFHPEFKQIPNGFPSPLKRMEVTYDVGVIRAWVRAYFAITPATLQFGAELGIRYTFGPLSFGAEFSVNALLNLPPDFSFVANVGGKADIKFRGHELLGVSLQLRLEGPDRWRAKGHGTFTLLVWDEDIDFDEYWGEDSIVLVATLRLEDQVRSDLENSSYWRLEMPGGAQSYVTLAAVTATQNATDLLAHPLARLSYTQQRVPFGLELQRYGFSPIEGIKLFPVPKLTSEQDHPFGDETVLSEYFSVAHYRDVPPEMRLAQAGFQLMPAGVASGGTGYVVATQHEDAGLEYETIFRDELVTAIATPWKPDQATLLTIAAGEAAARSEFRWRTRIPEPLPPVETRAAPKSAVVAKETLAAAAVPSAPSWAQPSPALLASVHANVAGAIVVEDFEVTA